MSEVLNRFRLLAADFSARVNWVPDQAWDNRSPCSDWKARDVVIHVIGVARRNLGLLDENQPAESNGLMDAVDAAAREALGEDPAPAAIITGWHAVKADMEAALADPERAGRIVSTPMGELPFETLIGRFVCADLLIHTWDLARAAGLNDRLNADAVAQTYEGMKPMDAMLRSPGFFAAKVDPPPDADLQTEFLSFLGRKV